MLRTERDGFVSGDLTVATDGQDWKIDRVDDYGPAEFYRWRVTGRNHSCRPGEYGYEFSWRVPRWPSSRQREMIIGRPWAP
jgi:hypothetical protein